MDYQWIACLHYEKLRHHGFINVRLDKYPVPCAVSVQKGVHILDICCAVRWRDIGGDYRGVTVIIFKSQKSWALSFRSERADDG